MDEQDNIKREINRLRKCIRLFVLLRESKITFAEVLRIEQEEWELLAKCASINPPSPTSQALIREAFRVAEDIKNWTIDRKVFEDYERIKREAVGTEGGKPA